MQTKNYINTDIISKLTKHILGHKLQITALKKQSTQYSRNSHLLFIDDILKRYFDSHYDNTNGCWTFFCSDQGQHSK